MDPDWQDTHAPQANDDEPHLDVPAGLLGRAIELLGYCNELFNQADRPAVGTRRVNDHLATTAIEMQALLDNAGIVVDPTLPGSTRRHHQA
jgi:hypothetical protein